MKKHTDLPTPDKMISPSDTTKTLDDPQPRMTEFNDVLKRARAASAPDPIGIPYKVCKNCPKLQHRLFKIIKLVLRKGRVVNCWFTSEGIFAPNRRELFRGEPVQNDLC